jgi:hypothetical protein
MDDLKTFIAEWEKTGDISVVLEKGLTLPPADQVQSFLASRPEAEQTQIRRSLENAMTALEAYTASLETEAADIKSRIDQSVKTAKACMSYNSAETISRRK